MSVPPALDPEIVRCEWVSADPLEIAYHDQEWGVSCHDDQELFERLLLESFQAGLSWITILRKRENFRRAFDGFDPVKIATYEEDDYHRLMADAGIIRNRLKVLAATRNARVFLAIQDEFGSFDRYVWAFAPDLADRQQRPGTLAAVPATSPASDALSKDLKRRGMTFVGSTICYAFMQSTGIVDDHVATCFRAMPGISQSPGAR